MYNPPPPQGYGYNSPYGTQTPPAPPGPSNTLPGAEPGAKSAIGLPGNAAGALAYLSPFNIIFAVIEKDNRFVRFNAFQSLFAGLALLVIDVTVCLLAFVLGIAAMAADTPSIALVAWLLVWAIVMIGSFVFLALIIVAAVKAYNRQMFKMPVVGNWSESLVRKM